MAAERAARLRSLHRPGQPVILPNVWDVGSARMVVAAGFPAIATSSAAVADALGFADGEATPADEMLDAVARIVDAVPVPVTADLERGYGMAPAQLVERVAATGAVGVNLEDSDPRTGALVDASKQADFLQAVREAARTSGSDLVINARIDTYLACTGTAAEVLDETLRRAALYFRAGADCVYPIDAAQTEAVRELAGQAGGPVNILSAPGAPSLQQLAELGVARVSFGAGVYRAMQAQHARLIDTIAADAGLMPTVRADR